MGTQITTSNLRRTYDGAKERCNNPNHISFKYYGARGIEFKFNSYTEFCETLGEKPIGTSLDRIDVNKHYEVGNVRWATPKEQSLNVRFYIKGSIQYKNISIRNPTKSHPYVRYLVRTTENNKRVLHYIGKDLEKAIEISEKLYG